MSWFKNKDDNYIYLHDSFNILKKAWLILKGYREVDTTTKTLSILEEERNEIYLFLRKKQSGV